jgi:hypothetical protein
MKQYAFRFKLLFSNTPALSFTKFFEHIHEFRACASRLNQSVIKSKMYSISLYSACLAYCLLSTSYRIFAHRKSHSPWEGYLLSRYICFILMWLEEFTQYSVLLISKFFPVHLHMFMKYIKLRLLIFRNALIIVDVQILTLFKYNNNNFLKCPKWKADICGLHWQDCIEVLVKLKLNIYIFCNSVYKKTSKLLQTQNNGQKTFNLWGYPPKILFLSCFM